MSGNMIRPLPVQTRSPEDRLDSLCEPNAAETGVDALNQERVRLLNILLGASGVFIRFRVKILHSESEKEKTFYPTTRQFFLRRHSVFDSVYWRKNGEEEGSNSFHCAVEPCISQRSSTRCQTCLKASVNAVFRQWQRQYLNVEYTALPVTVLAAAVVTAVTTAKRVRIKEVMRPC